jgi:hypothetical protein
MQKLLYICGFVSSPPLLSLTTTRRVNNKFKHSKEEEEKEEEEVQLTQALFPRDMVIKSPFEDLLLG